MAGERKKLQRDLAQHLRKKDRATLADLRARIELAQVNRRAMLSTARMRCSTARVELRDRQRAERERLRDAQRAQRGAGKVACAVGREEAREVGRLEQAAAAKALRDERRLQREVRAADKRASLVRSTKRERAQEDDDAVRANLPPDLVPVFDQVKKKIKGSPRKSRTEAFLQWAEENPGEIVAVQQADADAYLAKLLQQEKEHHRAMRKTSRYRQSAEALARELERAAVPF